MRCRLSRSASGWRWQHSQSPGIEALESRPLLAAGLLGEYFNEINLTGLADARIDPVINFQQDWGAAPPGTAVIADDNYSERWTGYVSIDQPGDWTFYTTSNDGVRLWVAGTQIIDNWNQHVVTQDVATVHLTAGWHPIRLEHFQQAGTAEITLSFSGPGQSKTIIPSTHLNTEVSGGSDPIADAGPDQVVVLPDDDVTLSGSATDDGTIVAYEWVQQSGPNDATLSGASTPNLVASNLVEGTYTFQLTVTDNDGKTDTDSAMVTVAPQSGGETGGTVSGELKKWHKVTITFEGPQTSETANPNPFTDYRLDVTFTHLGTGRSYRVPGYYAADGNAANTGATSGNKWRVHFAPSETGQWTWVASFRTGNDVAMAANPNAGSSAGYFNGATGTLTIAETDKTGRDLRGRGLLEYVGGRYLQFAETGEFFLKQGADAPENLLAYSDFDGPLASDGQNDQYVKDWQPHVQDWNSGDPTWGGGKGKGLIGAVNYLASEGLNAFSVLTMNIGGDDRNVFPYLDYNERLRMDASRLDQWEIVFEHADHQGMFLHFKTQETENELLLDGGNVGPQRTLYYRELIARFSHHLAMNWNLGEEVNNATTVQKQSWAQFFHDNDPYQHHIVIHNGVSHTDLMGPNSALTGFSLQTSLSNFLDVHDRVLDYINLSAAAGKQWAVAADEPGDAEHALRPDNDAGDSHEDGRKNALWGTLLAGGWGNEWYFGYAHAQSDLTLDDFRSRDHWWDYTRYALEFFNDNNVPFWEMHNDNSISSASNDYGFVKDGEVYVVYLKNGDTTNLDLSGVSGTFNVRWFDPRHGGPLLAGTVQQVQGGGSVSLGQPPHSTSDDWTILVTSSVPGNDTNDPPVALDNTVTTPEDTAYAFDVSDFPFSDAEGDALVSVTFSNLSLAGGRLIHSADIPVSNGDTLTAAEVDTLVYTPPLNATGSPLATFEFTVNDAHPGVVSAQMEIDVTPVSDPPPTGDGDLIFSDSFEDGTWNGKWVEDSQNDWFRSTQRATDGNTSAEVDGSANNATLTTTNSFDLTAYGSVELRFSWYIESGWDQGEGLFLDLFDGTSWNEVRSLRGNVDDENEWHAETVILDGKYLVDDFRIRFRADVSSSSEDGNIDDVRLIATSPAGPPNQLPTADAGGPYATSEGSSVTLDGSASFDADGTIVKYEWDLDGDGQYDDGVGATPGFTPLQPGTLTIGLRVTDDRGGTAIDTAILNVSNVGPTAKAGGPYVGNQGSNIMLDASGSSEPGNHIVAFDWDLDDDGQFDDASGVTVVFSSAVAGEYPVAVRVTDDGGASSVDSTIVTVTAVTGEVVVFEDSFEVGTWNGNWVEDSQNDWSRSTRRATDGDYSAEVDGNANDATLTTADSFDLSGYAVATLTFSWYIESEFDSGEYLALDISLDGGLTWQTDVLRLNGNRDEEDTWHHETVDLTQYSTSNLRFRFRAKVSSSSEDANVDNVRLVASGTA